MEHSPLYSHGTKAIEQRYLRYIRMISAFTNTQYMGVAPSMGWHSCISPQAAEVALILVLRYAMPCHLDSHLVPCNARAIIALRIPIIAAYYELVDCSPKV